VLQDESTSLGVAVIVGVEFEDGDLNGGWQSERASHLGRHRCLTLINCSDFAGCGELGETEREKDI
jgi:hypothetical protein